LYYELRNSRSMKVEIYIDDDLHSYGMSLVHCWLELILPDCLNGLIIQPHAKMANQANILWIAL